MKIEELSIIKPYTDTVTRNKNKSKMNSGEEIKFMSY